MVSKTIDNNITSTYHYQEMMGWMSMKFIGYW
jgi:hypothetical protein